jgi:hypothetical protein
MLKYDFSTMIGLNLYNVARKVYIHGFSLTGVFKDKGIALLQCVEQYSPYYGQKVALNINKEDKVIAVLHDIDYSLLIGGEHDNKTVY